jgi:hypothetical protein
VKQRAFAAAACVAAAVVAVSGQGRSIPRTPHGDPDMQGVWNFATATPMERPIELATKDVLTDQEIAEFEIETTRNADADRRQAIARDQGESAAVAAARSTAAQLSPELTFAYNNFWYDTNRNKVVETRRTSLVVDPPEGRVPPVTEAARARLAARAAAVRGRVDGPEDRGISERCIVGFNAGPPMTPSYYNNNVQIFQAPGYVAILNEMVHNARIIPTDGRPHGSIRQWSGDSRGRWEGETLVVETVNFKQETSLTGSSANTKVVERFTRIDPNTIRYEFRVEDPTTYTRPWSAVMPLNKTDEWLFEYACHEGNYGLFNIMAGARQKERGETATQTK